jgi:hypothetical protein
LRRRLLLSLAVLAVPALSAACNGILGIDAPTLEQDGGADARADVTRPLDGTVESGNHEDGSMKDAPAHDDATRDVKTDTGTDAGLFNGHCACTSDAGCPPVPLVSGQASPQFITVDVDGGILWANSNPVPGTIWHANLDGTNATQLVGAQALPQGIAYAKGYVYWTNEIGLDVVRCDVQHCTQEVLGMNLAAPEGIAAGPNAVFVAVNEQNRVYAYSLVDGGQTLVAANAGFPFGMATDSKNVYWAGQAAVYGCPLAGCADSGPIVYGRSPGPQRVASNDTTVFWTDNMTDAVYSAPAVAAHPDAGADGGPGAQLFFAAAGGGGIAADSVHVYVATLASIVRADVNGGNVTVLAEIGEPGDLALSESCVYWVDGTVDAGHVYATAK